MVNYLVFTSQIVFFQIVFLHGTLEFSFYIDVVLTLSMVSCYSGWETSAHPLADASENLAGQVENRLGQVEFRIG